MVAKDASGNAAASGQAGKFTRWLEAGRVLLSAPLELSDWGLSAVLRTVDYSAAWVYRPGTPDPWASHDDAKVTNSLTALSRTEGAWVDVGTPGYFTVAGAVVVQTTIPLNAGWTLVPFPSFSGTYTAADLIADVGADRVEGHDPTTPPYFLKALEGTTQLKAGEAYWILVGAAVDWLVSA